MTRSHCDRGRVAMRLCIARSYSSLADTFPSCCSSPRRAERYLERVTLTPNHLQFRLRPITEPPPPPQPPPFAAAPDHRARATPRPCKHLSRATNRERHDDGRPLDQALSPPPSR